MDEEVKHQILQEQPCIMLNTEECYSDSEDRSHHRFGINSLGSSLRSSLRGSRRRQQQLHSDGVSSAINPTSSITQRERQYSLNSIFHPTSSNDHNHTGTTTTTTTTITTITTISNAERSVSLNDNIDSSLLGLSSLSLSLPTQPLDIQNSPTTIITTNTDSHTDTDTEKVIIATTESESSTISSLLPQKKQQQPIVNLELSQQALDKILDDITLIPVDCSFGIVSERKHLLVSLKQMIRNERRVVGRADVMIMFAIRRPGCGACREHGKQLTELINTINQQGQVNVGAIGIIKHINVDNNALLQFYNTYYKFPIYKDEKWCIYKKLLGDRKVTILQFLMNQVKMQRRYDKANIVNIPFGGDLFTQGGVIVFDRYNNIRYIQYENYTELLKISELKAAIIAAKVTKKHNNETTKARTVDPNNNSSTALQDPSSSSRGGEEDYDIHMMKNSTKKNRRSTMNDTHTGNINSNKNSHNNSMSHLGSTSGGEKNVSKMHHSFSK